MIVQIGISNREALGKIIKERRKNIRLTQLQLAKLSGLAEQTVKRIENANYWPNLGDFIRITGALDMIVGVSKKEEGETFIRLD